jgi:alpha/beta superfamily hydrolase
MSFDAATIDLVSDDIRLDCWAIVPDDPRGVAILLHGVAPPHPDPSDPTYEVLARSFAERGWATLWPDMRGVRGSDGNFSIEGWVHDAMAAIAAARELAPGPLVLLGNSAGGAVASTVAAQSPPDALILVATPAVWMSFDDPSMALKYVLMFTGMRLAPEVTDDPTEWASEYERVTGQDAIGKVDAPILIVHGTDDDVVPVKHSQMLSEAAPSAEVRIIDGADHRLRHRPDVVAAILDWLDREFPPPDQS